MSKQKKAIKIVVTTEDNKQEPFGEFEGLSSLSSHGFDREHEEFMVASEMNKIFTKEKERLIRNSQVKMDAAKT